MGAIQPAWLAVAWVMAVGLATLIAAWRWRDRPPAAVLAVGLIGSFLVAPYINGEDLVLLAAGAGILLLAAQTTAERAVAVLLAASSTFLASGALAAPALAAMAMLGVAAAGSHSRARLRWVR